MNGQVAAADCPALQVLGLQAVFEPVGISVGTAGQSCVFAAGGNFRCWGLNEYGELGVGDLVNRGNAPLQMGDFLPLNSALFVTSAPTVMPTAQPSLLPTDPTAQPSPSAWAGGGSSCRSQAR